jgi:hypothetical protein
MHTDVKAAAFPIYVNAAIFYTENMMKNMLTPYYMAMQWKELYSKQHIEMRLFIYLRNEEKYRK